MSSRRFRRAAYARRPKRNSERIIRADSAPLPIGSQGIAYYYVATDACTVRSIKLDLGVSTVSSATVGCNIPYVLVHVREGYNANTITYPAVTDDLYNPTNDVLISGVLTDTQVEDHRFNSYGRKLKKGDRLCLIFFNATSQVWNVAYEVNFSVLT